MDTAKPLPRIHIGVALALVLLAAATWLAACAIPDAVWAGPLLLIRQLGFPAAIVIALVSVPVALSAALRLGLRRRWRVLGGMVATAMVALVIAGGALQMSFTSPSAGVLCARKRAGGVEIGVFVFADFVGYGPVLHRMYELHGNRRTLLAGCDVDISPHQISTDERCVLEPSAKGDKLAFRTGARHVQLFELSTHRCLFDSDDSDGRSARIRALMR